MCANDQNIPPGFFGKGGRDHRASTKSEGLVKILVVLHPVRDEYIKMVSRLLSRALFVWNRVTLAGLRKNRALNVTLGAG